MKSKWPTIEEQLRVANVAKGSALDKLIRESQDLHLLPAHEAHDDTIGLPLWLRVHWRKNHPQTTNPHDPTGGYPRVLRNVHQWMLLHPDLKPEPAAVFADREADRASIKGGRPRGA